MKMEVNLQEGFLFKAVCGGQEVFTDQHAAEGGDGGGSEKRTAPHGRSLLRPRNDPASPGDCDRTQDLKKAWVDHPHLSYATKHCHCERPKGAWQSNYFNPLSDCFGRFTPRNDTVSLPLGQYFFIEIVYPLLARSPRVAGPDHEPDERMEPALFRSQLVYAVSFRAGIDGPGTSHIP
jgi:hypothetical protein